MFDILTTLVLHSYNFYISRKYSFTGNIHSGILNNHTSSRKIVNDSVISLFSHFAWTKQHSSVQTKFTNAWFIQSCIVLHCPYFEYLSFIVLQCPIFCKIGKNLFCIVLHEIFVVNFFVNSMKIIQLVPFQVCHKSLGVRFSVKFSKFPFML